MISVTVTKNRLPAMAAALPDECRKIIAKVTADCLAISDQTVPRDTGNLANTGTMDVDDTVGYVGYGTDYAIYVHEGTIHMAARPWLREAAEQVEPSIAPAVEQMIRRLSS